MIYKALILLGLFTPLSSCITTGYRTASSLQVNRNEEYHGEIVQYAHTLNRRTSPPRSPTPQRPPNVSSGAPQKAVGLAGLVPAIVAKPPRQENAVPLPGVASEKERPRTFRLGYGLALPSVIQKLSSRPSSKPGSAHGLLTAENTKEGQGLVHGLLAAEQTKEKQSPARGLLAVEQMKEGQSPAHRLLATEQMKGEQGSIHGLLADVEPKELQVSARQYRKSILDEKKLAMGLGNYKRKKIPAPKTIVAEAEKEHQATLSSGVKRRARKPLTDEQRARRNANDRERRANLSVEQRQRYKERSRRWYLKKKEKTAFEQRESLPSKEKGSGILSAEQREQGNAKDGEKRRKRTKRKVTRNSAQANEHHRAQSSERSTRGNAEKSPTRQSQNSPAASLRLERCFDLYGSENSWERSSCRNSNGSQRGSAGSFVQKSHSGGHSWWSDLPSNLMSSGDLTEPPFMKDVSRSRREPSPGSEVNSRMSRRRQDKAESAMFNQRPDMPMNNMSDMSTRADEHASTLPRVDSQNQIQRTHSSDDALWKAWAN